MPATLRKAAPVVTGRSYARRVASLTGGSRRRVASGAWVAEARGVERRRRAVACRLGRLTGTRVPRWGGEIGEQDWLTVLAAGADALLALADSNGRPATPELIAMAKEFVQESADAEGDAVVDRTRNHRAEAVVNDLLTARAEAPVDGPVSRAEREAVERWSPFRSGPRYVCRSGRYGDGTPAEQH